MSKNFVIEKDWETRAGLRAVCLYIAGSHRCGYVGVTKDHPLYGVEYWQHSEALKETMEKVEHGPIGKRGLFPLLYHEEGKCSPDIVFDVHGGITYSGGSDGYPVEGDEWWFGFDCAHAGDATGYFPCSGILRTQEYVESECESLAKQLAAQKEKRENMGSNPGKGERS